MPGIQRSFWALAFATLVVTPTAASAQLSKAGVVTTLYGTATVSRASLSQPIPLKFKDDVFAKDRVSTGDDSVARILLGGKAIVTVRERSSLTITELPGVSTVDVGIGRAAVAVAKERMKPGETIEIRTPNAVAGIRGTIVVVEVDQTTAQAGPGSAAFTTRFTVLTGEVLVRQLQGGQPFGSGVTLRTSEQARLTGLTPPVTRRLSPAEAGQLSNSFKATKTDPPAAVNAPLVTQSQTLATQAATSGVPNPAPAPVSAAVTNVIQNSNNTGSSDKRRDQAAIEALRLTSKGGVEDIKVASDVAKTTQLLNSLPDSVKTNLIQQLNSGSSGSGTSGSNSGSGSSGSGSTAVTLSNGQTVQVILKDGKLKVDNSGRGGHRGRD